jgi:hypothetical protein
MVELVRHLQNPPALPGFSVLRALPPSQSAWPVSHELPVDPHCDHCWDFPCCLWSRVPACRRHYPGRTDGVLFARILPSTSAFQETGAARLLHYAFRGLLSVYSRYGLLAHLIAFSDLLHQRLQRSRCLHRCSDCYRVERARAGLTPAVDHHLFTAHPVSRLTGPNFRVARHPGTITLSELALALPKGTLDAPIRN